MLEVAGYPSSIIGFFIFLTGLALGSFGNVLICRLPFDQSILGRSHCPLCKKELIPLDLIPVVSYVFLLGRCRSCKERISLQYPLVELGSAALAVLALFIAPSFLSGIILALTLWILLLISVIDARIQGIPDIFNILFIVLAFLYTTLAGEFDPFAFIIGVGFFGSQWLLSRGMWIGSGDVLFAVGLSALLGTAELVVFMLLSSYIIGAAAASILLLTRKMARRDHIAFGPFLAFGTLLTLLVGDKIMSCLLWSARACTGLPLFLQ
jgi:leader peptidase (prepilin peptidase)/N-methyltransferase